MAISRSKTNRVAEQIIGLRDPFLPLTNISRLVRLRNFWQADDGDFTDSHLEIVWEQLAEHATWLEDRRSLCWFDVHPDRPFMVGGVARPIPDASPDLITLQERWLRVAEFDTKMSQMSPDEFEGFGRTILSWYGITNPLITKHSGDGGIDFIGEGRLGEIVGRVAAKWTVVDACRVTFVGQAKKYDTLIVGTSDLRELVGSVVLMQRESYRARHGYEGFSWTLMQPRVLLFITTSRFSADAVVLAEDAGIILADRDQLCKIYMATLSD